MFNPMQSNLAVVIETPKVQLCAEKLATYTRNLKAHRLFDSGRITNLCRPISRIPNDLPHRPNFHKKASRGQEANWQTLSFNGIPINFD